MKYLSLLLILLLCSCNNKKKERVIVYTIKDAIMHPDEVSAIKMGSDEVSLLDSNLQLFSNVKSIIIGSNKWIVYAPGQALNLEDVHVVQLPTHIQQLNNLQELIMFNCCIDQLPDKIILLDRLETLKIAYTRKTNLIVELAKIKKIKNLKEIDLSHSLISSKKIKEVFKETLNLKLIL